MNILIPYYSRSGHTEKLALLFSPLRQRIEARGGAIMAHLAISSHFHEFFFFHEMEYVFRLLSRLCFHRSLRSYTLESQ